MGKQCNTEGDITIEDQIIKPLKLQILQENHDLFGFVGT